MRQTLITEYFKVLNPKSDISSASGEFIEIPILCLLGLYLYAFYEVYTHYRPYTKLSEETP